MEELVVDIFAELELREPSVRGGQQQEYKDTWQMSVDHQSTKYLVCVSHLQKVDECALRYGIRGIALGGELGFPGTGWSVKALWVTKKTCCLQQS